MTYIRNHPFYCIHKWAGFFLFGLLFLLGISPVGAQDFGLVLRGQSTENRGEEDQGDFEYSGAISPWFAAPLGEQGDLYLSGGFSMKREKETPYEFQPEPKLQAWYWQPIPELYRFELAYRFATNLRINVGRILYQEPLHSILDGLIDGVSVAWHPGNTRLSAGAFYTGLLYKKTAYIAMNSSDSANYFDRDTYFASKRMVFSLGWEINSLFNSGGVFDLSVLGQFDLNGKDDWIHSQYGEVMLKAPLPGNFTVDLGLILGLLEDRSGPLPFSFAAQTGLIWFPPSAANDRLTLGASFSSGVWSDRIGAFLPINSIPIGRVLQPAFSGIALVQGGYARKLLNSFFVEVSAVYFFRTDTKTFFDLDLDQISLSPLLGGEVSGSLIWAPVSDLSFVLEGGAFLPQTGNAFNSDAAVKWQISLETIFSF
ncbi:hypothetical protein TREPR_0579 [Treponema primitia ZAS-2]|uniref:Alginate export domain-containing protein n=1 Tax=Treponema primitia (strain ATCC BAA-887 / DSM 12427 / ZAS-2) TaxID=545694 RepID=F5YKR3_TREPZ|nr:hypothetical protein [Treponema primitia]AEF84396.1 hypothetical protein TREPR_0579 [Treponema primitia ZAS-2]